jgi:hypothetical protein
MSAGNTYSVDNFACSRAWRVALVALALAGAGCRRRGVDDGPPPTAPTPMRPVMPVMPGMADVPRAPVVPVPNVPTAPVAVPDAGAPVMQPLAAVDAGAPANEPRGRRRRRRR